MTTPLEVLIVEDHPADAKLMLAELRAAGFEPRWQRVEMEADYVAHLERGPELVISDYSLPQFDAFRALQLLRARGLDVPFIIVSGTIGEDLAVQAIHAGAHDYLHKDRLGRLGVAARRALEEKRLRDTNRRAEEALRESVETQRRAAALTQAIVNALPAHVALLDPQGTIVAVNDAWRRFAEANHFQAIDCGIGTNYLKACGTTHGAGAHEAALAAEGIRSVLAGTSPEFVLEYPCAAPGDVRWFQMVVTPLSPDRRSGAVVMHVNITERRVAEEQLRRSEEQFRGAFDDAAVGMALVATDGRYLQVNHSLCLITGYAEEELLATTFQAITHPDDLEKDLGLARRALAGEFGSYRMEKRYIHKDGHVVWIMLSVALVHDDQGRPSHFVSMIEDITQRKRAEEALARYVLRITNLHQLDQTILATHHPRRIADEALSDLRALVPCWNVALFLLNLRRRRVRLLASEGAAQQVHNGPVSAVEAFGAEALSTLRAGNPVNVSDVDAQQGHTSITRAMIAEGVHSFALVPLTAEGRLIGTLRLDRDRPGGLESEEMETAREVADQLAIGIRHAQLFQQVRRGRRRLAELSTRLFTTQEAERRHLARELHDEIGQALTALKLNLQAIAVGDSAIRAALVQEGSQTVDQLIAQVRNLSLDLRPSMLDDFGLVSALRWFADRVALRSKLDVKFFEDLGLDRLPATIETACFRIVQEALTNVTRYAFAKHAWVQLSRHHNELTMVVQDDGVGFDVSLVKERAARGTGLGLLGMRERAALLGGRIEITSTAGQGTEVRLILPLGAPNASPTR